MGPLLGPIFVSVSPGHSTNDSRILAWNQQISPRKCDASLKFRLMFRALFFFHNKSSHRAVRCASLLSFRKLYCDDFFQRLFAD